MIEKIKEIVKKIISFEEEELNFIDKMLKEIHEDNLKKKKEAMDLMESWKKNPKLIK